VDIHTPGAPFLPVHAPFNVLLGELKEDRATPARDR
jgi:hypothetical protein